MDGGRRHRCWRLLGDTALYFAPETRRRVYSFEFIPSNLDIMNRNLQMNPDLRRLIEVVPNESCGVPYEIYFGHYTIHNDETVLFAIPKAS